MKDVDEFNRENDGRHGWFAGFYIEHTALEASREEADAAIEALNQEEPGWAIEDEEFIGYFIVTVPESVARELEAGNEIERQHAGVTIVIDPGTQEDHQEGDE